MIVEDVSSEDDVPTGYNKKKKERKRKEILEVKIGIKTLILQILEY